MTAKQRLSRIDIRTRLTESDLDRFRTYSRLRGLPPSELARRAIVAFLDAEEQNEQLARELIWVRHVKSSTTRICALLSKVAIDVRAIYFFLCDLDGPESTRKMRRIRAAALEQISRVLTDAEKAVSEELGRIAQQR